ncbi:phosphopantetheine-binding protein [Herbivorax sp. ANBcel31]|uniref:phosphopantetheine-binding protein n=1 Tax=Herbivorax sp. ANBcel31 TaxID=3069754 RepID=UPI0027B0EE0F|nr:phosphopantetheine-binding protein [Herbivorax sp. ANBcel31]MDQ2086122.1 phosphopantetheine-binding protein [Herbivorax sp. ANBcel31]
MEYNDIYQKAKELIVDYLRVEENEVNLETDLVEDLCADSIALVELGFKFSETFSVPMIDAKPELFVVKNIVDFLQENGMN